MLIKPDDYEDEGEQVCMSSRTLCAPGEVPWQSEYEPLLTRLKDWQERYLNAVFKVFVFSVNVVHEVKHVWVGAESSVTKDLLGSKTKKMVMYKHLRFPFENTSSNERKFESQIRCPKSIAPAQGRSSRTLQTMTAHHTLGTNDSRSFPLPCTIEVNLRRPADIVRKSERLTVEASSTYLTQNIHHTRSLSGVKLRPRSP